MSRRVIWPGGMDFISSRVAAISTSRPTAGAPLFGRPCLRRDLLALTKILCPRQLSTLRERCRERLFAWQSRRGLRLPRALSVDREDGGDQVGAPRPRDPALAGNSEPGNVFRRRRDPLVGPVLAVGGVHHPQIDLSG